MSAGPFAKIVLMAGFLLGLEVGLSADRLGWAEEGFSLEKRIAAIESLDRELEEAKSRLKEEESAAGRRKLQARVEELQEKQERALQELEEIVGPLPPTVRSERSIPLEQQIKAQERRHETALESNVERRLPNQ